MSLFKKAPPPPPPPVTRIGARTTLEGTLKAKRKVEIEGTYKGSLESSDLVLLAEGAVFEGELHGARLDFRGKGNGLACVGGLARFSQEARWEGEVRYGSLQVLAGARLEGPFRQGKP